jgi:HJR/Mrr/RecB family endonuclease
MSLSDTNARLYRTLKAFFQTRICFNTSTVNGNQTSSKPGTERLIPGDFFLSKNSSGLTECLESVFVSDLEVTNLVTFLKNSKNLPSTFFPEPLTSSPNQEEKDTSYEEFIAANKDLIDKFCEIATRKISTIDEYGNENWEALNQEKQRCFLRVASKLGLSERFLTNTFLELDQQEAAGLSDQTLASKLGSQLRFALQQINKEYVPLSYHLVKLYFIDLEKILREYYGSHEKIQKTPANFNDLSGVDFEVFIEKQLKDLGFGVVGTPVTGDQGADIVADKDGKKYVIQAKRYTSTVGNKAVQEVVAAKNFYQGDIAVVITNSKFTPAAKDLAQKNKVLLVDGDSLTNLSKLLESFNQ